MVTWSERTNQETEARAEPIKRLEHDGERGQNVYGNETSNNSFSKRETQSEWK